MSKYFINYADNGFFKVQKIALEYADKFGFITKGYTIKDIDEYFKIKNNDILSQKRGAGYWIWKPFIILDTLKKINYDDYLIYMDSGANLIKSPDSLLNKIDERGILAFSTTHLQSTLCKKDLFEAIFNNDYDYSDKPQMLASYIFLKKTKLSIEFIQEWLKLSESYNLITDSPSISKNYSDFIEHRHDQAIYSLLVYKKGIEFIPDISQWCSAFEIDPETRIVEHHRKKN